MDRVIFGSTCDPSKSSPYLQKVKRRVSADRFVVQFGLILNALVIGIIVYAELFLR